MERDRLVTRSVAGMLCIGPVLLDDPERCFNDGICDPRGRLLIGTLHEGDGEGKEVLLRIDPAAGVETIAQSLSISNGLGFDPEGYRLYHADTLRDRVIVYDYTTPIPVLVGAFDVQPGYPDGLTVDAEGYLWAAVWGESEVRRYSPDGTLEARLPIPGPLVTAPAFVGAGLDRLVITTATGDLEEPPLTGGGLYRADVGVRGGSTFRWAGSTN